MPIYAQLALYSPIVGVAIAVYYFLKYRRVPQPKRRLPPILYVSIVVGAAVIAFFVGKFTGIQIACRLPENPGNLCGLFGFIITGPISATLAMIIISGVLAKRAQRAPRSGDHVN